jgi:nicotinamidase-related amidase
MERTMRGPEIDKSALLIVDMQNVFVHPEGGFAHRAREAPEAGTDLPFLTGTIPSVQRLADAFHTAGRPVVYIAHMVKPDYSDAQFPCWRIGLHPGAARPSIVEGTWGA